MSLRASLRSLIDALEDRYALLAVDATSFTGDMTGLKNKVSIEPILAQYDRRDALSKTLQSILSSIHTEMRWAKAYENRLRNSQQPAATLPATVLGYIFETCCWDPGWWQFLGNRRKIMTTCSQWRTIALSTPALWSQISIPPRSKRTSNSEPPSLEYTRLQLHRSHGHPIDVIVHTPMPDSAGDVIIPSVASRCRSLSILGSFPLDQLRTMLSNNIPLPLLRDLTMHVSTSSWDHHAAEEIVDLRQALFLCTLQVHIQDGRRLSFLIPLRLEQLTCVSLVGPINPSSSLAVVKACCRTVEKLVLEYSKYQHPGRLADNDSVIQLPRLDSLSLSPDWYRMVPQCFAAPNLHRLRFKGLNPDSESRCPFVPPFPAVQFIEVTSMRPSSSAEADYIASQLLPYCPTIQNFYIAGESKKWTPQAVISILTAMPNLREVWLNICGNDWKQGKKILLTTVEGLPVRPSLAASEVGQTPLLHLDTGSDAGLTAKRREEKTQMTRIAESKGYAVDLKRYFPDGFWEEITPKRW